MCSVVKYFYNSPHVFYCKVQSDNPRCKTFVRPKIGCVGAKIGSTGQLDRRQAGNYFKPCTADLSITADSTFSVRISIYTYTLFRQHETDLYEQ